MWQRVCVICGWADAGVFWRDGAEAARHLARSAARSCPACDGEAFDLAEVAERADLGAPMGEPGTEEVGIGGQGHAPPE